MSSSVDLIKDGIDGLIRAGRYRDREALLEEAFRALLEQNPALRSEMALELYKSEKVSLGRAAEIAGTSQEGFKRLMESRGIKRVIRAPSQEEIEAGVEAILG
jgi:predicted HTH domain antitoxin